MRVNLDLAKTNNDNLITDELLSNVGSSAFLLEHDRFFGSTDMEIWTGVGKTGTQLTDSVDYSLQGIDSNLTAESVAQIYSEVIVLNATYQTGDLYFNYHAAADEMDALDRYTIKPPSETHFIVETTGAGDIDLEALGTGDVLLNRTGARNTGIGTGAPTLVFSVSEKAGITPIGGFVIRLINKTGSDTVAGQLVQLNSSNDDAFNLIDADEDMPMGVILESGISDGAEAWIVISGIADVAMEDNTAATHGNWVRTSVTEAGYADATNAGPPGGGIPELDRHMKEIGHCLESVSATGGGTHILARCILHFN